MRLGKPRAGRPPTPGLRPVNVTALPAPPGSPPQVALAGNRMPPPSSCRLYARPANAVCSGSSSPLLTHRDSHRPRPRSTAGTRSRGDGAYRSHGRGGTSALGPIAVRWRARRLTYWLGTDLSVCAVCRSPFQDDAIPNHPDLIACASSSYRMQDPFHELGPRLPATNSGGRQACSSVNARTHAAAPLWRSALRASRCRDCVQATLDRITETEHVWLSLTGRCRRAERVTDVQPA